MGAEPDLSPPPPEPTLSPEPEIPGHDNRQDWKADMMSALGESVSFGRFLAEPLEWGKWSAFAHNRYLEEAAVQSRPGSVAQKKAFFEAHYARKRRKGGDDAAAGDLEATEDGGAAAAAASWSTESSCMTDQPSGEEVCGDGVEAGVVNCGGGASDAPPVQAAEEPVAVADASGPSCRTDAPADEFCCKELDEQLRGGVLQSQEKQDLCTDNLLPVDALQRQPLKESSIINQDITDSAKKRRLQMPSLLQKPTKFRSPPSGKKGHSSSVKRRSPLHSAKENASPPSTDSSKHGAASIPKKRSTLAAFHMSMTFTRCETENAASSTRNLGATIAERISQLESASRPVESCQPQEFRPPRKTFTRAPLEIHPRTSQVDEQRSSHVMRVKEKLFGSTSPSLQKKTSVTKGKETKFHNEQEFKESWQSFCFKSRPLPNFYRRNKQAKDSSQQIVQEIPNLQENNHPRSDVSQAHQIGKGVPKEKQMCCFPIRKLY